MSKTKSMPAGNTSLKERLLGYYATRIYLPFSHLSQIWQRVKYGLRRKQDRFSKPGRLPTVSWRKYVEKRISPRLLEHEKANGNVRISELGILAAVAADCPANTSLFEIGTFDGRTTINLALNSPPGCTVYTLDIPPDQNTKFELAEGERHMVDKKRPGARYEKYRSFYPAAVSRIHQLLGDSAAFDYTPYRDSCSLVFVDGSHAYEYAVSDTRVAMTLVRPGGRVLWHDYGIWAGVTKALDEFEEQEQPGLQNIRGTSLVCWKKPVANS